MPDLNERRRFPRIKISLPLQYGDLDNDTQLRRGTLTRDISEGGARFITDRFIPLKSRLIVEINLPIMKKLIRTVSKVAWIRKLAVGDGYTVGNQFLTIQNGDRAILSKYLNQVKPS